MPSHSTENAESCNETWFNIPGYEGLYQLSNLDRVKSLPRRAKIRNGGFRMTEERILELVRVPSGYLYVNLRKDNIQRTFCLHQLKLLVFVGPCPEGMECRHLNGDAADNRLENLRWGTTTENQRDRQRHGTSNRDLKVNQGEKHWNVKLTKELVREIRRRARAGERPCHLCKEFGVNEATIRDIRNGKSWSHLSDS